jgi:D-hexose-6-phosphate mutarotase
VPDLAATHVAGLESCAYMDKADNMAHKVQKGEVAITGLTDRIYLDVPAVQTLKLPTGNVKIESGARCAVVWNAWNNDKDMADMGEGNHVGYLCVERGDVAEYAVTLPPGGKYTMSMTLSC